MTSAKSTKFENLKRYQQQVFQNRRGSTSPATPVSNPGFSSKTSFVSPEPVYSGSGPAYPGQLVTKNSLHGRPTAQHSSQYEMEYIRSKPVYVVRDRYGSSTGQHYYRDEATADREVKQCL